MTGIPSLPRPSRPLLLALGLPALLVVAQQQLLVRQAPQLEELGNAPASSGPAALQARFSRPMQAASLQQASRLTPPLAHSWLGSGSNLLLSLAEGQRIEAPLELQLAGRDERGLTLQPSSWHWDPRPRVLAVVGAAGGEQLQLREHDGSWRPISPVWPEIPHVLPLGDGSGVAAASREPDGQLRLWRIPLRQRNLRPADEPTQAVRAEDPQPLQAGPVLFAHLSSNRQGDLLVQSGQLEPGSSQARLQRGGGWRWRRLPWSASGPMLLLPEGGAVVVPDTDGLHLETLPPQAPRRQTLPGSRDLSSFCPQAGRALLQRHWPDFRRSLELLEPGQPPKQLWLGEQALVASACSRSGDRVWALLMEGSVEPRLTLLALNRQGVELGRRLLSGWELEPGSGLHWDATGDQLLTTLRPRARGDAAPPPARAVLIDATSLELRPLQAPVKRAQWLVAG
ncbi:hypothetical protein KBY96_09635 [Cyanobium sp. ATX 6A2]|uniref:hypothetical protein n=1 Tax=Cyanobium sp. ATX 6A2 TaxID=2823700 RepID=UPI0020CC3870|nr:hypothetical protein [Cyanobium sp. ATX 6A2]MCP9888186.1 hypothetical protein [Cyanobium sp. ATX 6A2]